MITMTTYIYLTLFKGKVCYQVFDDENIADQPTLDEVNYFIQKKYNVSFNGVWMIVVEWRSIHAYPHSFATRYPHFYTDDTWTLLNKVKLCFFNQFPLSFFMSFSFYRQIHFKLLLLQIMYHQLM